MKSDCSHCCGGSWKSAALSVAGFQWIRGTVGTGIAILLMATDISDGVKAHGFESSLLGIRGSFGFGLLVDFFFVVLHMIHFCLANLLLKGIELGVYEKFTAWLWTVTIITISESASFAMLMIEHNLTPVVFFDPVINLIGLYIVHRYVIQILTSRGGLLGNANQTLQDADGSTTGLQIPFSVLVDSSPRPPSYEDCIAVDAHALHTHGQLAQNDNHDDQSIVPQPQPIVAS